jgi:RNA polymerase sigma-70 factor (ECF subfamily)
MSPLFKGSAVVSLVTFFSRFQRLHERNRSPCEHSNFEEVYVADNGTGKIVKYVRMTDEEVVGQVLRGEIEMFEVIMRRHNRRLYRIARAILGDGYRAEDVVQEAYVRAYEHLAQFAGRAKFSTWLTHIAVNEALAQFRRGEHNEQIESTSKGERMDGFASPMLNPEQQASALEMRGLLERSIDALPDAYRAVIMMRDVEEMSTIETSQALDITEENVKTRLHRAHKLLRAAFYLQANSRRKKALAFLGARCDRLVKNAFARIACLRLKNEMLAGASVH